MDRGAWWAADMGLGKSQTWLKQLNNSKTVFDEEFKVVWKFLADCVDLRQTVPCCSVNPFLSATRHIFQTPLQIFWSHDWTWLVECELEVWLTKISTFSLSHLVTWFYTHIEDHRTSLFLVPEWLHGAEALLLFQLEFTWVTDKFLFRLAIGNGHDRS